MDAETNPFAIFYTTNPFTSVIVGQDFDPSGYWYEDWYGSVIDGEHPVAHASHSLGYRDTEWIVAHGCSALPVVYQPSTTNSAIPDGKNIWSKFWHKLHIVFGHNSGIYLTQEPELGPYATSLKTGVPMRQAYFDIHTNFYQDYGVPTALSAENDDSRTWIVSCWPHYYCPPHWEYHPSQTMMYTDKWTSQNSDIPNPTWWFTSWKVGNNSYEGYDVQGANGSAAGTGADGLYISADVGELLSSRGRISLRGRENTVETNNVGTLRFTEYTDDEVLQEARYLKTAFGFTANDELKERASGFVVTGEHETLYINKGNSSFKYRKLNADVVPVEMEYQEAVEEALVIVNQLDILRLKEGETLELMGVNKTWNAFYDGGAPLPEQVQIAGYDPDAPDKFVSEVEVVFGRRYYGIPILGSKLIVRMGANAELTGVSKFWRDIDLSSSNEDRIAVSDYYDELANSYSNELTQGMVYDRSFCGYFEASVFGGRRQSQAPLVCDYYFTNHEETLSGEKRVRTNMTPSIPILYPREEKTWVRPDVSTRPSYSESDGYMD